MKTEIMKEKIKDIKKAFFIRLIAVMVASQLVAGLTAYITLTLIR